MKRLIFWNSTAGLACSRKAAVALFGESWEQDSRNRLLYCGIDLKPFVPSWPDLDLRARLGIPKDVFVVGHVGRFSPQKNHEFLIQIAAELIRRESNCRVVLVGDGPLRVAIETQAREAGISANVVFAGLRSDVSRLMTGVMDVFLLPSHHEGLPVVLMETQAAELPAVISDVIAGEADIVPGLVKRMSLSSSPGEWADAVLSCRLKGRGQLGAIDRMQTSPFNIQHGVDALECLYAE